MLPIIAPVCNMIYIILLVGNTLPTIAQVGIDYVACL